MAETDRGISERAWAAEDAQAKLAPKDLDLWRQCRVSHRLHIFEGRIFVLWKLGADQAPRPITSLRVTGTSLTFERGLEVEMLDASGRLLVVPQHPVRVFQHEVFFWNPYFNDVTWLPHPHGEPRRVLRLALVMRMRNHSDYMAIGDTYVTDVSSFRAKWPQFAGQKF